MKPTRLSNIEWRLPYPQTEPEVEAIATVPGLRMDPIWGVGGLPDAVAAACHRLGLQNVPTAFVPKLPESQYPADLRRYQGEGIAQLAGILSQVGGALLADDMGLGKTRQFIELARCHLWPGARVLIVCPAFVRETWRDELKKWGEDSIAVLEPASTNRQKREWDESGSKKWVITSYALADRALGRAFSESAPTLLGMDEAHMLRGREAARSKALETVARMSYWKVAMTATPAWSRPRDFYRILRILFGGKFGTPSDFDFAYCAGTINEWGGMENKGISNADELKLRLSYYMVRRTKLEVLSELPPITRQVIWTDATKEGQGALHAAMMGGRDPSRLAAALEATLAGKLEVAVELAVEAGKFLLFTYRRDHAAYLTRTICERGVPCVCITGDIPTAKRALIVKAAQEQGQGIVATIDSMGAGINLQGVASIGIMHALDWVPLKMAQAEARIHRMGQTQPVQWIYLAMKESMDVKVVQTVVQKLDQWQAVMGRADTKGLRDDLGAHIDGAGAGTDDMLRAIYDSLTEDLEVGSRDT